MSRLYKEEKMPDLIELLKLPPVILAAITLASGIVLLLPDDLASKLYMSNFRSQYGFAISLTFLVSFSILICYLIVAIAKSIKDNIKAKKVVHIQENIARNLDEYEKDIMREFMRSSDRTVLLPMNTGIVRTLQHKMLIAPAGSTHLVDMSFEIPFLIQPWAHEFFTKHPECLE